MDHSNKQRRSDSQDTQSLDTLVISVSVLMGNTSLVELEVEMLFSGIGRLERLLVGLERIRRLSLIMLGYLMSM
jgi:hypothetical protein